MFFDTKKSILIKSRNYIKSLSDILYKYLMTPLLKPKYYMQNYFQNYKKFIPNILSGILNNPVNYKLFIKKK